MQFLWGHIALIKGGLFMQKYILGPTKISALNPPLQNINLSLPLRDQY